MGRNLTRDRNGNPYRENGPIFNPVTGYHPSPSDYWPQSQDRGSYRVGDLSEQMKGDPIREGEQIAPGITWLKTTAV